MKKLLLILLCFLFIRLFCMEAPEEKRGVKRPAQEELKLEKEQKAKKEKEQALSNLAARLNSSPSFQILPPELRKIIIEYVLFPHGPTKTAQLRNAANAVRNLLMTNKEYAALLSDPAFNGAIIEILGDLYIDIPEVDKKNVSAALALATDGAHTWLFGQLLPLTVPPPSDKRTLYFTVASSFFDAIDRNDIGEVRFLFFPEILATPKNIFEHEGVVQRNPFEYAILTNRLEIVKFLISKVTSNIVFKNPPRQTPLIFAIVNGKDEIVKMLLDANANVNLVSGENRAPLAAAAVMGNLNALNLLLQKGASLIHHDNYATALMYAAERGHLPIVQRLLEAGAENITVNGQNALTFAHRSASPNKDAIIKLLLARHFTVPH